VSQLMVLFESEGEHILSFFLLWGHGISETHIDEVLPSFFPQLYSWLLLIQEIIIVAN
jgi:hypothetical protein